MYFMSTHVIVIPSRHNEINFSSYLVDALLPYDEQVDRRQIREKYIGRQSSPAINQYKDPMVSVMYLPGKFLFKFFLLECWHNIPIFVPPSILIH
jgi:hypothetical protein